MAVSVEETQRVISLINAESKKIGSRKVIVAASVLSKQLDDDPNDLIGNRVRWHMEDDLKNAGIKMVFNAGNYEFELENDPGDSSSSTPQDKPNPKKQKRGSKASGGKTFTKFVDKYIYPSIFPDVRTAVNAGFYPVTVGPHGSGKSRMFEEIAKIRKQECRRLNLSSVRNISEIIGKDHVMEQDGVPVTKFIPGILPTCMEKGWMLICDDFDLITPAANSVFLQVSEECGSLIVETESGTKVIEKHPDFRLCLTANTWGRGDSMGFYSNAHTQNYALLSRFGPRFFLDYDPEIESEIVSHFLPKAVTQAFYSKDKDKTTKGIVRQIRDSFNDDKEISEHLSFRTIKRFAKMYREFGWNKSIYYCFLLDFPEDLHQTIIDIITRKLGNEFTPSNDRHFIKKHQEDLRKKGF